MPRNTKRRNNNNNNKRKLPQRKKRVAKRLRRGTRFAALRGFSNTSIAGRVLNPGMDAIGKRAAVTLSGRGDYRIKANSLMPGHPMPRIINKTTTNAVTVRHREFLGDIITSANVGEFTYRLFTLNPGLDATFPFLAQIAANFDQYVIEGMVFEFRSMSADALNSVNTALGTVIMATNYNVLNSPFGTKAEMEAYEYSNSSKPSESMCHYIECDPKQSVLDEMYVRAYSVPAGSDPRMYDLGFFQIATTGFQGTNVNIGELWVTYQVALLKPKLFTTLGSSNTFSHYHGLVTAVEYPWGRSFPENPSLNTFSITPTSTLATVLVNDDDSISANGGTRLYFPETAVKQRYVIGTLWTTSGPTAANLQGFTGNNVTFVRDLYAFSGRLSIAITPGAGAVSSAFQLFSIVDVPANSNTSFVLLDAAPTVSGGPVFDLQILQITINSS